MGAQLRLLAWALFWFVSGSVSQAAEYRIKDLQLRRPHEYAAHQSFQQLTIGAYPCDRPEKVNEIFDVDNLLKEGILPILLVIDNQNDFPVQLASRDIFLVDPSGELQRPLSFREVLLRLYLEKPASQYPVREEILLEEFVDRNAYIDFRHKSFREAVVAPGMDTFGVLFFPLPKDGDISGFRLYLPEIVNTVTNEPLIFFEFELSRSQP